MKKSWWALTTLVSVFGLWGCDGNDHAKGPGSETTNGIFASVFSGEIAASYANVCLHSADYISDDTSGVILVPSNVTDSSGNLILENLEEGKYRLTVSLDGKYFSKEISYTGNSLDLGEIYLDSPGSVSGSFANENGQTDAVWVGVYGLDVLVRVDSNGNFTLPILPSDDLKLFALTASRDSVLIDTNLTVKEAMTTSWIHTVSQISSSSFAEGSSGSGLSSSSSSSIDKEESSSSAVSSSSQEPVWMVFEDFEDSASFAKHGWYFSADTSAQINYPTSSSNYWTAVVDNSELNSHVFSGYYTSSIGSYVIFGTQISSEGIDMSALDSITFYAKGSGSIRLALERWNVTSTDNLKAWTEDLPLNSTWTHFCVTPEDFQLPENDTLSTGWESVKKTVTRFHFFGLDGQEISLDDITVYGLTF